MKDTKMEYLNCIMVCTMHLSGGKHKDNDKPLCNNWRAWCCAISCVYGHFGNVL